MYCPYRVSDWEMKREGWSPTLATLDGLQQSIGAFEDRSWKDAKLKFLCGADLLESFPVPDLWKPEDVSFTLLHLTDEHVMLYRSSYRPACFTVETSMPHCTDKHAD